MKTVLYFVLSCSASLMYENSLFIKCFYYMPYFGWEKPWFCAFLAKTVNIANFTLKRHYLTLRRPKSVINDMKKWLFYTKNSYTLKYNSKRLSKVGNSAEEVFKYVWHYSGIWKLCESAQKDELTTVQSCWLKYTTQYLKIMKNQLKNIVNLSPDFLSKSMIP